MFFQRYATSKGLWDHELNDVGKFSYNNIMMYDAFYKGALLAEALNDFEPVSYTHLEEYAKKLKNAGMTPLVDADGHFYKTMLYAHNTDWILNQGNSAKFNGDSAAAKQVMTDYTRLTSNKLIEVPQQMCIRDRCSPAWPAHRPCP